MSFKKIKELPEILLQNIHNINMQNLEVAQNYTLSLLDIVSKNKQTNKKKNSGQPANVNEFNLLRCWKAGIYDDLWVFRW